MKRPDGDRLSPTQQTILDCVQQWPGQFGRSSLAKLLAGSHSSRVVGLAEHPAYGRLAGHGRKAINFEIDILLQQSYLVSDPAGKLIPVPPHPDL
jgi:hypothetical protein